MAPRGLAGCALALFFLCACGFSQQGESAESSPDASTGGAAIGGGPNGGFPSGGTAAGGGANGGSGGSAAFGGSGAGGAAGATGGTGAVAGSAGVNGGTGGASGAAGTTGSGGSAGAPVTCDSIFAPIQGVQLCPTHPQGQCAVAYGSKYGVSQSCDTVCTDAGGKCVDALDDSSDQTCVVSDVDNLACNYKPFSAVCFCGPS